MEATASSYTFFRAPLSAPECQTIVNLLKYIGRYIYISTTNVHHDPCVQGCGNRQGNIFFTCPIRDLTDHFRFVPDIHSVY